MREREAMLTPVARFAVRSGVWTVVAKCRAVTLLLVVDRQPAIFIDRFAEFLL